MGRASPRLPTVDLLDEEPLEIELATTLLYEHSRHSYRQLREAVLGLDQARREEIIDLGMRHRGAPRRTAARLLRRAKVPL